MKVESVETRKSALLAIRLSNAVIQVESVEGSDSTTLSLSVTGGDYASLTVGHEDLAKIGCEFIEFAKDVA